MVLYQTTFVLHCLLTTWSDHNNNDIFMSKVKLRSSSSSILWSTVLIQLLSIRMQQKMISKYLAFEEFQLNSIKRRNHYQDHVPVNISEKLIQYRYAYTHSHAHHAQGKLHFHQTWFGQTEQNIESKWNGKKEIKGKFKFIYISLDWVIFSFVVFISLRVLVSVPSVKHPLEFSSVYTKHCFLIVKSTFIVKNFYS